MRFGRAKAEGGNRGLVTVINLFAVLGNGQTIEITTMTHKRSLTTTHMVLFMKLEGGVTTFERSIHLMQFANQFDVSGGVSHIFFLRRRVLPNRPTRDQRHKPFLEGLGGGYPMKSSSLLPWHKGKEKCPDYGKVGSTGCDSLNTICCVPTDAGFPRFGLRQRRLHLNP